MTTENSIRVRTRFAPSPTGFIHLGNIRSALYPWAFARSTGGDFILRIEDTDQARSTQASVDVILEGMAWLGMVPDEGPFYQMARMDRYREVLAQMKEKGLVYPCYMSVEALDALREAQMAAKQKPRYDGTWRPEPGKVLPSIPEGVKPVWRFKNPTDGVVAWDDKVKGRIEIANAELDDLVIARPDGTPTYNFCVVVDDMIDTGGTIVKASEALFENGASDVIVTATHGIFSSPASQRLQDSGIREVIVTDTLPIPAENQFSNLTILPIAPLLARAIKEVFDEGSVASLFDHVGV